MRVTVLSAAAAVTLSAFAATAPAEAAFHLIRWDGTGVCQIWDEGVPGKPIPSTYKMVSKPVPTFTAALAVKDGMLKSGSCKL